MFTGDTIFSECTTWLMTSDVDGWIAALDRIGALDVEFVVPGHGPVQPKAYLARQRAFLIEWTTAVAVAVADGLDARGDDRPGQLRDPLPGRYRAGVHDGVHPGAQRGRAVGQAHGPDVDDVPGEGAAEAVNRRGRARGASLTTRTGRTGDCASRSLQARVPCAPDGLSTVRPGSRRGDPRLRRPAARRCSNRADSLDRLRRPGVVRCSGPERLRIARAASARVTSVDCTDDTLGRPRAFAVSDRGTP